MVSCGLAVLYRFGPSRAAPRWEWLMPGSVRHGRLARGLGPVLLVPANFAHYDATYGSLGAAIGLMMWMWLSVIVILFGAELNSEIEHQTARDTTVGPRSPSARAAPPWQIRLARRSRDQRTHDRRQRGGVG